ncbi:hypothetical protein Tco_0766037 [Tanacetum coccineum]
MMALIQTQQQLLAQLGYNGNNCMGHLNITSGNTPSVQHVTLPTRFNSLVRPTSVQPMALHIGFNGSVKPVQPSPAHPTFLNNPISAHHYLLMEQHHFIQPNNKIQGVQPTSQDPTTGSCNMDTCASSYLNAPVHSLSDVFNIQHTWHQRLEHLGSEVLGRLVSSNSISCDTLGASHFDIVHSDL